MAQIPEKSMPKRKIIKKAQGPWNADNLSCTLLDASLFIKAFHELSLSLPEKIRHVGVTAMIRVPFVAPAHAAVVGAQTPLYVNLMDLLLIQKSFSSEFQQPKTLTGHLFEFQTLHQ